MRKHFWEGVRERSSDRYSLVCKTAGQRERECGFLCAEMRERMFGVGGGG